MSRKRYNGRLEDMTAFKRRKYCDTKCMSAHWVMSKTAYSNESNSRSQARKRKDIVDPTKVCETCGKTGRLDVHHIDENPFNNDVRNLKRLCRSCHMKQHRKKGVCKVCDNPVKGHGYCEKHYIRFKKYGNPYWCNGKLETS